MTRALKLLWITTILVLAIAFQFGEVVVVGAGRLEIGIRKVLSFEPNLTANVASTCLSDIALIASCLKMAVEIILLPTVWKFVCRLRMKLIA